MIKHTIFNSLEHLTGEFSPEATRTIGSKTNWVKRVPDRSMKRELELVLLMEQFERVEAAKKNQSLFVQPGLGTSVIVRITDQKKAGLLVEVVC